MGVISGATIMAPITVAVESDWTPAVAITAERHSSTQNFDDDGLRTGPEMYRAFVMRSTSAPVTLLIHASSDWPNHGEPEPLMWPGAPYGDPVTTAADSPDPSQDPAAAPAQREPGQPIPREAIIEALHRALAADPEVLAAFLGGSDATGRTDPESDIDLVVVVAPGHVEATFATIHRALTELGPISLSWRLPDPTWHGNPQEFLALRDADPAHFLDVVVQQPSGGQRFLEPERHGTPVVLFDRAGALAPRPLDADGLREGMRARLAQLQVRFLLFQTLVERAVHRGFPAEAAFAYQSYTLGPLIEVLRMRHCPDRYDFGARYLDRDLPDPVRAEVESLALPATMDQILAFQARCQALFLDTIAELDG